MNIILNGQETEVRNSLTIEGLLSAKELSGKPVAIERNGKPILPQAFSQEELSADDQIEIIVIAAGG